MSALEYLQKAEAEARDGMNLGRRIHYAITKAIEECGEHVPAPVPAPSPTPAPTPFTVVIEGDSNNIGYVGYYVGAWKAKQTVAVHVLAKGGEGMDTLHARIGEVLKLKPDLVYFQIGANDLGSYASAQAYLDKQVSYARKLKAGGVKEVAVGQTLPIANASNPAYAAKHNALRKPLNSLQNASPDFDVVVPLGEDPVIGTDAAALNKTLYRDGVHLADRNATGTAGHDYALAVLTKALHDHIPHVHAPTPTPVPTPTPTPGATPFSDVRFEDFVVPATPHTAGELNEGAFRYTANIAWLDTIDPIVYPGKKGAAHLHKGWGNTETDQHSTYETLSTSGSSTITGDKLFRSAEWTPCLIVGGQAFLPDVISGYYKLAAPNDRPQGIKEIVNVPVGLKLIYGNTMTPVAQSRYVRFSVWDETFKTLLKEGNTLADVIAFFAPGRRLRIGGDAPNCWDGKNTDSPDHRSHMAYTNRDPHTAKALMPDTHPYLIPSITRFEDYTLPDLDLKDMRLSSDMPGFAAGSSMHWDYMECIHPEARRRMFEALMKQMNCSASDFGDGWIGKRPAGFTFAQRPNLVPVP